jgi:hypothetical protein
VKYPAEAAAEVAEVAAAEMAEVAAAEVAHLQLVL